MSKGKSMKLITIALFVVLCASVSANTKKEEKKVVLKKGGAVSAFSKEDGFKLTKKAIKNLDVKFMSLGSASKWKVPSSSIVRIKNSIGVYRRYDGWITLVLVDILKKEKESFVIKSVDLQEGDGVATSAVKFLRMTDADLNSDTVDACAH